MVALRFGALANDGVALFDVDALETPQQLVDVSRRQLRECAVFEIVYAEHSRQDAPVDERRLSAFVRFPPGRGFGGGELIPGHYHVEQFIVDAYQLDVGDRPGAGEHCATPPERGSRLIGAA